MRVIISFTHLWQNFIGTQSPIRTTLPARQSCANGGRTCWSVIPTTIQISHVKAPTSHCASSDMFYLSTALRNCDPPRAEGVCGGAEVSGCLHATTPLFREKFG